VRNLRTARMSKVVAAGLMATALAISAGAMPVAAQGAQAQAAEKPKPPVVPLKVVVVISRFQGEKKTASLPFSLWVLANDSPTSIQMGSDVPVPTMTTPKDGGPAVTTSTYRPVGTNINCSARSLDDGTFRLYISLNDSQIFSDATGPKGLPVFQTFTNTTNLAMRDGQTIQFAAATDKASGETIKIDVTMTVVK